MKPSWKRLLLVWYIDAWPVHGVVRVFASAVEIERYSWAIAIGTLIFLEWALDQLRIPSFGHYALGIRKTAEGNVVDQELRGAAHWVILLLATIEWLSAWRFFGRVAGDYPFYYFAGLRLEGFAAKFVGGVFTLGLAWAALALFRCKRYAIAGALSVAFLFFVNDMVSREHTRELLDWYLMQRAAERGRPMPLDRSSGMSVLVIGHILNLLLFGLVGLFLRGRFRFTGPVWEEWRREPDEQPYQLP